MRKIWHIARNDLQIEFSERGMFFFFLILPIIFTLILGAGLQSLLDHDSAPVSCIPLLIVDEDHSALSGELLAALAAGEALCPTVHSAAEAERRLAEQQAPALLHIPAGFQRALLAGEPVSVAVREGGAESEALAARQAVLVATGQVNSAVAVALTSLEEAERLQPFESEVYRRAYFEQGLQMAQGLMSAPPARIETEMAPDLSQLEASSFEQSSAGQLVTWTLLTLVGAAEVLVNERVGGTLQRLLSTPTRRATVLAGKITGRLVMGLVQICLLIGFSWLAFGIGWGRSLPALALICVTFALAAVSFGILLATFSQTRAQAAGLTVMSSMLMAALGGAWWPLEITPPLYRTVAQSVPSTWAMTGFINVIVRGQGVAEVLPQAGVLLGFAVVFFIIGVWRFRYE